MLRVYSAALIIVMAASGGAHAAGCDNTAPQSELNLCAAREYRTADALLNQTYRRVVASLSSKQDTMSLLTAQRAWLTYRDEHCALAGRAFEGGSIQPLVVADCLREVTMARVEALETLIVEK